MGVLGLWSIIEAAGSGGGGGAIDSHAADDNDASATAAASLPSRSLALSAQVDAESQSRPSSVLCVDLSVWLMEANMLSAKIQHSAAAAAAAASSASAAGASFAGGPATHKHYLIYLLQRVCAFLRNSIRLIFVTDGRAPLLKSRIAAAGKDNASSSFAAAGSGEQQQQQRHRSKQDPRWVAQIRESTRLLSLLDLPVLTLERGEAEALAAALNSRGLCDGVLTTDGDAFLFGARRVLKNLEASSVTLSATSVDLLEIKKHTGLDREAFVLLALLLGSDYTSGVRSLGPRKAVKYLRVLERAARAQGIEAAAAAAASSAAASAASSVVVAEHPLMRIFRAVIDAPTPADAVAMLLRCHEEDAPSAASAGASPPAAAAAFSSSTAATPSAAAASFSPLSPSIDYASLSLPELKAQMARHGLKAQTKTAMIAKLQQIAARSPGAAAAAAAMSISPPPSAVAASSNPVVVLSDSDEDDEWAALDSSPAALAVAALSKQPKPRRKKPAGGGASSKQRHLALSAFLTTYVPKIHARYHPPAARSEMELIITSYLRPELHPKVDVLEKAIHTRIPSPNFMALRAFLASECGLSFVRFEKLYLPVELHLHLWALQHSAWQQAQCREALRALQDETTGETGGEDGDDDVIECTPPTGGEKAAAAAPPSSTSTVPLSGSSSSSAAAAATNSQLPLHYTPSHISKRRIIGGCACFVLVWSKTALGNREIATLPQALGAAPAAAAAAAATGGAQATEEEQAEEEEMDLTVLSQSPVIAAPAGSPRITPSAASSSSAAAAPAASAAAAASSKRLLLQDTTLHLFEAPEPAWFLRACLPEMVAAFEAAEAATQRAKEQAKEQSKVEKQAAKDAKEQAKKRAAAVAAAIDAAAATASGTDKIKKPRAPRKQKGANAAADSNTPSITSFLSPLSSSQEEESPPCPVSSLDPLAPPEVLRKQLLKHRVRVEVDAAAAADEEFDLTPAASNSGRIEFKSIKGNPAFEALAQKAPTILASIIKCAEASASASSSSSAATLGANAYTVAPIAVATKKITTTIVERKQSQQSTLRGFVSQTKVAAVVASASPASSSAAAASSAGKKKPIPTLPPSSRAKPAVAAPASPPARVSSSSAAAAPVLSTPAAPVAAAAPSSSAASPFSSTLSVCPLCGCAFPPSMLQSHVNSCLDEQQEAQDAAMAQSISAEPPAVAAEQKFSSATLGAPLAAAASKAPAVVDDDDEDDFNLSAEMADEELVVVSDASSVAVGHGSLAASRGRAASPARPAAAAASSRSKPLTPQKRKQGADDHAASPSAAAAAAGIKAKPAAPVTAARTLIDLLDSDDDDEQPGSTLYRSSKLKQRN